MVSSLEGSAAGPLSLSRPHHLSRGSGEQSDAGQACPGWVAPAPNPEGRKGMKTEQRDLLALLGNPEIFHKREGLCFTEAASLTGCPAQTWPRPARPDNCVEGTLCPAEC